MGNSSTAPKLEAMARKIDAGKLMGDWFVIACTTTPLDRNCVNAKENYQWTDQAAGKLKVTYTYQKKAGRAVQTLLQDGRIHNRETQAEWRVRPRVFGGHVAIPVWLAYLILDTAHDSHMVVGYPDRSLIWIMSRTPEMDPGLYAEILKRAADDWKYDFDKIKLYTVPQVWDDDAEKNKRPEAAAAPAAPAAGSAAA